MQSIYFNGSPASDTLNGQDPHDRGSALRRLFADELRFAAGRERTVRHSAGVRKAVEGFSIIVTGLIVMVGVRRTFEAGFPLPLGYRQNEALHNG